MLRRQQPQQADADHKDNPGDDEIAAHFMQCKEI